MKYPSWQKPLEDALRETDPQKLESTIRAAELALVLRAQALMGTPDGRHKLVAIDTAKNQLLRIKTERLGWPGISDPTRRDLS